MAATRPLTSFSCLTFDCYATLVDWERGVWEALAPLNSQLPASHPLRDDRLKLLKKTIDHEGVVQKAHPDALYAKVLAETYGNLAKELGVEASEEDKRKFGASVGDWPIFPDTLDALNRLHKFFKLVILSNVDKDSFNRTLANQFPGFTFDAIYTAEEIGSYKPDLRNFQYLIEHCETDLGVKKDGIIHTAQALPHDHVPAKEVGLASAWIERGEEVESAMGGKLEDWADKVAFSWRFKNMREMADAVEAAAAKQ
jgi:2-haloalkanoic acid dehalogenase type II